MTGLRSGRAMKGSRVGCVVKHFLVAHSAVATHQSKLVAVATNATKATCQNASCTHSISNSPSDDTTVTIGATGVSTVNTGTLAAKTAQETAYPGAVAAVDASSATLIIDSTSLIQL